MKWYKVYISCMVRDNQYREHRAGLHGFIQAESEQDALKKTENHFKLCHARGVKVLRAEECIGYIPTFGFFERSSV